VLFYCNFYLGLARQTPWTYSGNFMVALSGTWIWGDYISDSGNFYGILQLSSLISQSMIGLVVGKTYKVSWKQMNRPGFLSYNELNVEVDSLSVYKQSQVKDVIWTSKSAVFTAQATSQSLKFYSTDSCGTDCSVFLDTISVDVVPGQIILDGGFESYAYQIEENTGVGLNLFLGIGTPM
jgi:hypothetical protein